MTKDANDNSVRTPRFARRAGVTVAVAALLAGEYGEALHGPFFSGMVHSTGTTAANTF